MLKKILFISLLLLISSCGSKKTSYNADDSLTTVINKYRVIKGLPAIPISPSLSKVARAHVVDLEKHQLQSRCNMHSWSDNGDWTDCCYTSDHAKAQCMWDKPKEITHGAYKGNGYEIAAMSSNRMTPHYALTRWQSSTGHHNVILNKDVWTRLRWNAIGAAISAHYAVVWFAEDIDPAGK